MSAATPKYSCAPPRASRNPTNTSSKMSTIPRSRADLAQLPQPFGVGLPIEARAAAAVDQRAVAGRVGVGVHRLQRIHQHARDVLAGPQHAQRVLVHVLERVGLARRRRIADARLHVAPPAVVGAAEPHQVRAPRVIARQAHRLHHRLGPRHVERHLVEPRERAQAAHVVGDDRVVAAQHRPELAGAGAAAVHALLVEVVAEHVDAVRAGQIVEDVAVEIGDGDARRRTVEGADAQVLAHEAAVLERHPVGGGELQVGQTRLRLLGELARLGEALVVEPRQAHEPDPPPLRDVGGRVVGAKDALLVVLVERDPLGEPEPDARVPAQRRVLRPRQLQTRFQPGTSTTISATAPTRERKPMTSHDPPLVFNP